MRATLYNINKKVNSTALPSGGVSTPCDLKEPCSHVRPTLLFATVEPFDYNYIYLDRFNRYYWIDECVWVNGIWQVTAHVDVLATYRDDIISSTLYITRSAVVYDSSVIDTMYPATTHVYTPSTRYDLPGWSSTPALQGGSYVVGMVNGAGTAWGSLCYYVLSTQQMSLLRSYMMASDDQWDTVTEISGQVIKALIDPLKYVVSCKWFPLPPTDTTDATTVDFGFWQAPIPDAKKLNWLIRSVEFDIDLPEYPSSHSVFGDWQLRPPYAEYELVAMPWGKLPIDRYSVGDNGLHVLITVDFVTGLSTLYVYRRSTATDIDYDGDSLIGTLSCNLGVNQQLSQIIYDFMPSSISTVGVVSAGVKDVTALYGSLFSGNDVGSAFLGANANLSSVGTTEGFGAVSRGGSVYIQARYFIPVAGDNVEQGRPYCHYSPMSQAVGGFCKVAHGGVECNGTATEKTELSSYLEGGFYLE